MSLKTYLETLSQLSSVEKDKIIELSTVPNARQQALLSFAKVCTWDRENCKFYIDGIERKQFLQGKYNFMSWTFSKNRSTNFKVANLVMFLEHGRLPIEGEIVDHINNKDILNDHPDNLRFATYSNNSHNSKTPITNKSGIKGITHHQKGDYIYWQAACKLTTNGSCKNKTKLFPYTDEGKLEAELWVQETRERLHGEFANHG